MRNRALDDVQNRENPYCSPAEYSPAKGIGFCMRDVLIITIATILVYIVAPVLSTILIRNILPPLLPATIMPVASWSRLMLCIAAALAPCFLAGALVGKYVRSSIAKYVIAIFLLVSMLCFGTGVGFSLARAHPWVREVGVPVFVLQQGIEVLGPIAIASVGLAVGRYSKLAMVRRNREGV